MASASCLTLFWHFMRAAASRTFCTAGRSSPIRIAMIAITTSNSISVKPRRVEGARNMAAPLLKKDEGRCGPSRGRAHGAGYGRGEFSSGVPDTRSAEMRDSREALAADARVEDPAGAHGQAGVQKVVEARHAARRVGW